MKRFVTATTQLLQEQEVLMKLEQTLRRMQVNAQLDRVNLLEFQQMVICQRQEMRNLKDLCPWNKTFTRMSHVAPFKGCMVGGIDSSIEEICKPTIGGSMQLRNVNIELVVSQGKAVGLVPNDIKTRGYARREQGSYDWRLSVTIVDAQKALLFLLW
ncbi:hypothetical protein FEM48_Zijuj10G0026000 [Ziziphus jujuba var. spinosa]|uniref:Uncharacterized protein n=1 Tax=Ziziphus jujuba var. spinosa TaxID=714518 RepID=A0A978UKT3_ZIZJJ|nr:hypothetical protein FEM48_Zijuj10G0026000 [Ziziphus jujuba var. spinosa]